MGLRAVLLDIGGVLEHTPPTGWVETWEGRLGLEPGGLYGRISSFLDAGEVGDATYEQIQHEVATTLALTPAASRRFWADLWAEYLGTLNSDLLGYVSSLRPAFRVALLSNSSVGAREREERAYGFSRQVDEVIYSHEEGLKKPDADFYLLACQRIGVEPPEVLFVDDREPCVAAARDLGMTAIRFTTEHGTIAAIGSALGPARNAAPLEPMSSTTSPGVRRQVPSSMKR